jgi:ribA/ribD-fused uncharacterized protein
MTNVISTFDGANQYLSNFYRCHFDWDNIIWPSSEHAYQAAKVKHPKARKAFSRITSPADTKQLGKVLQLREDWEEVKLSIMTEIVYAKFSQNSDLKEKLLLTGEAILEEGNTHRDVYWGICPPGSFNGQNHLSRILMSVRTQLRNDQILGL